MPVSYVAPGLFDGDAALRAWPFGDLAPGAYDFIMADPPWHFETYSEAGEDRSPQAHYRTMSLDAIAALPVADLARPDCLLWLWATAPLLPRQIEIAEAWGFEFKTSGVWVKRTSRSGGLAFGTGYVLRNAHEPFIVAARGNPVTTRSVRSVVEGVLGPHSAKPAAAYAAAEQLMPSARRCSLFERKPRSGWEGWGDEYGLAIETRKRAREKAAEAAATGPAEPALI